jgi:Zn-dependent protease with chaperone function
MTNDRMTNFASLVIDPMSTNFYERQAAARRTTKWLMAMFTISVICIVAGVFLATLAAVGYGQHMQEGFELNNPGIPLDDLTLPFGASAGTLALIGCGSLFKIAQLRGGGTTVAENLGGYRVPQNTTDPVERRLVNVVEEMAIAAGMPVPPIYLLKNEEAINAFAAGYSPSDAVVAVTRGTAEQLTRDQLQGVVAHEFSHILNGDMRLNIRLIGILHGILLIGLIGRMLFNIAARGGGNRRGKNDGTVYLLVSGLVLMLLGLLGTVFGNLIKAAVSRQREYLADSSAVQFTRNPEGIAGALKRIGASVLGSKLTNPRAAELSHMYFGQGVWEGITGLMATHPPLEKRIRLLDPHWNGQYPALPKVSPAFTESPEGAAGFVGAVRSADEVSVEVVRHSADQVGSPLEMHREYAAKLIEEIPNEILDSARDPYGARAVMFCLLMDKKQVVRNQQLNALSQSISPDVVKLTYKLLPLIDQQDARARLPLVDLALPALRSMTKDQYSQFRTAFKKLVEADQQISLFEWTLHRIVLRHLKPQFEPVKPPRVQYYNISRLGNEISVLLSTLANLDNKGDRVERSLEHAAGLLSEAKIILLPIEQCTLDNLQKTLATLSTVAPKQRQRIVEATAELICYDHDVSIKEAELFRGICDMLECPMPPLLPGQPLSRKRSA